MKHKFFILLMTMLLAISSISARNQTEKIEGNWLGTLEMGGTKMRLVLKIASKADNLTAKLDSIDQGVKDLPVGSIKMEGETVSFSAERFGLSYQGKLNENGDEINGTLRQGNGSFPLIFKRVSEIPKLSRPQDPQKPFPYNEEEVFYTNPKDDLKLAGTLTFPTSPGKYPAVILITGSGGQDRNSTIAGHRPFLILADYLTRRGIAVLRVDDRGIGDSGKGSEADTSENFAGDVLAGIKFLKTRKEIDPKKIGLIGHSEGGMIAPMAAVRSKDIAFIILLAGLGQTGEEIIFTQTELLQKAQGISPEIRTQTANLLRKIFGILKTEPAHDAAENLIKETITKNNGSLTEEQRNAFAPMEAIIKAQIPMYLSAWFRYFIAFDPRPTLEKVKVPVLAINGENDLQVAAKENLDLIAEALKAGKNKNFAVRSFPKLNHLFQTSQTGLPNEYGVIEETISPSVLETVTDWVLERTKK